MPGFRHLLNMETVKLQLFSFWIFLIKPDNINNNKWLSKTVNFTQGKVSPQVPKRTKIFVMGNDSVILPDNAITLWQNLIVHCPGMEKSWFSSVLKKINMYVNQKIFCSICSITKVFSNKCFGTNLFYQKCRTILSFISSTVIKNSALAGLWISNKLNRAQSAIN